MNDAELTLEYAKSKLSYDERTGELRWIVSVNSRAKSGAVAGCDHGCGYISVGLCGKIFLAHRLAWFIHFGTWPKLQLDHINGDKKDNRIVNLREVTNSQNAQNVIRARPESATGLRGVIFDKAKRLWRADIRINGSRKYLGYFSEKEKAHNAYLEAKSKYHIACGREALEVVYGQ